MNYMYLTRMSFFSPLSLFSLTFAIKGLIKKKIQAEGWTMDVQFPRINFPFEKKIHANFNIILSFPELSG